MILLAFASEFEMRLLARDYFEFSLILGGDVAGPTQEILRENDSMILFTTNQGPRRLVHSPPAWRGKSGSACWIRSMKSSCWKRISAE